MTPLDIAFGCLVMAAPTAVAYAQGKAGHGFWTSMAVTSGLPIFALLIWLASGSASAVAIISIPVVFALCAAAWKLGDHHGRISR